MAIALLARAQEEINRIRTKRKQSQGGTQADVSQQGEKLVSTPSCLASTEHYHIQPQAVVRSSTIPESFLPPEEPPPLLSGDQLFQLQTQGWLPLPLPQHVLESITSLFVSQSHFFDLPSDQKTAAYPPQQGTEFGYYLVPEEKEYLTLRHSVYNKDSTPSPAAIEETASKVWSELARLIHRILCDIARDSELPWDTFNELLDGTLHLPASEEDMTSTLMRMFRYRPQSGIAEMHTDLGLLTICIGDGARGLQTLDREQSTAETEEDRVWVDAKGPVVLVGQTLGVLSNGGIQTGVHRVVASEGGRQSIVLTLRHSNKHMIDLRKFGLVSQEATESMTKEDARKLCYVDPKELMDRIKNNVVNINATKDIREKQRKEREERLNQRKQAGEMGRG